MAILTLTLNPALDLETVTPRLISGDKLRCSEPRRDPGGGGINVARAVYLLGGSATAVVAVGGPTGAGLVQQLEGQGVAVKAVPAPGETRQNLSVIEGETGQQYRFIFPGPVWSDADFDGLRPVCRSFVRTGDLWVISGSMPPGVPPERMVDLARELMEAGAQVIVDTSGGPLAALAAAELDIAMLRMDRVEAELLMGHDLPTPEDTAAAAAQLVARGAAGIVVMARGAEGSVLAARQGRWFAPAAGLPVRSVTGAGDSFVAGAVLALSRQRPMDEVLQWGVAAASSAVTTAATELCDRASYEQALPLCAARPL